MEVVSALRSYGIPPQSQMPNTFGKGMDAIEPPPESLIEQAKNRRAIHAYEVPGRENRVVLQHIIRLLNDGQPVVIGTRWPPMRTLEAGHFLSEQAALDDYAHAVTLVGYRCETGRLEDARFIFKNSWGVNWGLAGYGFAWIGHFFFEHNRPATFQYPLYSLLGDWVMLADTLRGKLRF